jgi:hypothetical protein
MMSAYTNNAIATCETAGTDVSCRDSAGVCVCVCANWGGGGENYVSALAMQKLECIWCIGLALVPEATEPDLLVHWWVHPCKHMNSTVLVRQSRRPPRTHYPDPIAFITIAILTPLSAVSPGYPAPHNTPPPADCRCC